VTSRGPRPDVSATDEVVRKLQAVSDAALAHLSLDELLDELLERIRDILDADTCAVLLLDAGGTELIPRSAKGLEAEGGRSAHIPMGEGFAGRVAAERRTLAVEDVDHSQVVNPTLREHGVKSLLGAPLIADGRVLGVVHIGTLEPREFTYTDVQLLEIVAHRLALAVDRALIHDELVRLGELQREFIALAAHELRSPATTIYGVAATLHERRGRLAPETVTQLHDALYEQAERMRRLVDQLLDLSKLDAGTISITRERVSLRPHLEEIVEAASLGRADEVALEVPEELEALVDPEAVDHVVTNLISNALRYGAPPVVVSAAQRDRHVRIAVEDRGAGVTDDFVPYLFDRFRRSVGSPGKAGGTGLGLAIARSYARAHGGDLLYTAARPCGARFELVLPAELPEDGAQRLTPT
jgi:signal transduction histidine kinase